MNPFKNHERRYIGEPRHRMLEVTDWTVYRFLPDNVYLTTEREGASVRDFDWIVPPDEEETDPKVDTRKTYRWSL